MTNHRFQIAHRIRFSECDPAKAIGRMGDDVKLSLERSRLGTRSMALALACTDRNDELRMSARQTIVTISLETYTAIPILDDLRAALERPAPRADQAEALTGAQGSPAGTDRFRPSS